MGFTWGEYVETYMGFDDRDAFREAFRAKGAALDAAKLAGLVAAKSRAFQEGLRSGLSAYPGVIPLIESLHAAGLPLALCSGALRSDIDPILARLGVSRCFSVIVAADDVRKSKPDPESYALAFRRLSEAHPSRLTVPGESIAVEDTPAGIRSAKGAGLRVLAVAENFWRTLAPSTVRSPTDTRRYSTADSPGGHGAPTPGRSRGRADETLRANKSVSGGEQNCRLMAVDADLGRPIVGRRPDP